MALLTAMREFWSKITVSVVSEELSAPKARAQRDAFLRDSQRIAISDASQEFITAFQFRVSTVSLRQTPKFAIAPMPKVPTTPAFLAAAECFPLEPAFQKFSRSTPFRSFRCRYR